MFLPREFALLCSCIAIISVTSVLVNSRFSREHVLLRAGEISFFLKTERRLEPQAAQARVTRERVIINH